MVSQYADESNLICDDADVARRLNVLAFLGRRGLDVASMSKEDLAPWLGLVIWGDPDKIGEHFASLLAANPGLDGFTINMIPNGFIEGRVQLFGETLSPLINA